MGSQDTQEKKIEDNSQSSEGRISKYKIHKGAIEDNSNQMRDKGKDFSV